jgi:hypothetical protein
MPGGYKWICALPLTLALSGCLAFGGQLTSTKSPDIETLPHKLGMIPLLSTPLPEPGGRPIRDHGKEPGPVKLEKQEGQVYILPPTPSELMVTGESQIMTGLIATELSSRGFVLKEIPVETTHRVDSEGRSLDDRFSLSSERLAELHDSYGIEALVLGNALFSVTYTGTAPKRVVTAVYIKIVDITTLDLLGQVTFYDDAGENPQTLSEEIGRSIAEMAGLSPEAAASPPAR